MKKGIISLRVDCRETVKTGTEDKMTFTLADSEGKNKFEQAVRLVVTETPPWEGIEFPTYFTPQKNELKIPPKTTRKFTFSTNVANDYFSRDNNPGKIEFEEREDLQIKRHRLCDGLLEIAFYSPIEKIGHRPDIKLSISDAANHRFDFSIPFEIVRLEESSKLNEPKKKFITRAEWPACSWNGNIWNENDISSVESSRTTGLTVNLNKEAKPLEELKRMVGIDKRENAVNKYFADVYIHSLYLHFELKDEPNKDLIFGYAMRAVGKALPGMIRKIV